VIFEILYTSVLARNAAPDCVAQIVRRARTFNASAQITGLLVFDGERFCQLIEGPEDAVVRLAARIEVDPRHEQFLIAKQGSHAGPRRFATWAMGYALDPGQGFMEKLHGALGGEAMVQHMQHGLALLDLIVEP
jgi:Sensors of blue-light using FAD